MLYRGRLRRSLCQLQCLMVSVHNSAVQLVAKFCRYRETDLLVTILCFAAGHGYKQTVFTALDKFDSPDGKAPVYGSGCGGSCPPPRELYVPPCVPGGYMELILTSIWGITVPPFFLMLFHFMVPFCVSVQ